MVVSATKTSIGTWGLLGANAALGLACAAHFLWVLIRLEQNEPFPFVFMFFGYAIVFLVGWAIVGILLARYVADPTRSIRFGVGILLLGALLGFACTVGGFLLELIIPNSLAAGAIAVGLLLTLLCVGAAIGCGVVTAAVVRTVQRRLEHRVDQERSVTGVGRFE